MQFRACCSRSSRSLKVAAAVLVHGWSSESDCLNGKLAQISAAVASPLAAVNLPPRYFLIPIVTERPSAAVHSTHATCQRSCTGLLRAGVARFCAGRESNVGTAQQTLSRCHLSPKEINPSSALALPSLPSRLTQCFLSLNRHCSHLGLALTWSTRYLHHSLEEKSVIMPADVAKPVLPPLQTLKSASLPSEILASPLPSSLSAVKQEEDMRTPITPPVAYTDFLKTLTPVLSTGSPRSSLPRTFSFEDTSGKSTPTTEISTSNSSSFPFCRCDTHKSPPASASAAVPPSPFAHPRSARSPSDLRRLRIPPSPLCSTGIDSPRSSTISTMRSPFSPSEWALDSNGHRYFETPRSACVRPVSVRSVVTRTVTYKRTPPLEPAPKGKKRKMSDPTLPPPVVVPAAPTAVV